MLIKSLEKIEFWKVFLLPIPDCGFKCVIEETFLNNGVLYQEIRLIMSDKVHIPY
jgi:hypothetical protein